MNNPEEKVIKSAMLKVTQVAEYCGVSYCVVYRWITENKLPVHHLPGSGSRPITLVSREDLELFLARHRREKYEPESQTLKLSGRRLLKRTA